MAQEALDDGLGDALVDQSCPEAVAELVRDDVGGSSRLVVERDQLLPAGEDEAERFVGLGQGGIASGGE